MIPPIDAHTSLLVVSPHPDDETLCCAGVIQRVVAAGGRANVVWLTSGDASELDMFLIERALLLRPDRMRDLAARRMREARAAAESSACRRAQQFFLGYPDEGLMTLVTDHFTTPYYSQVQRRRERALCRYIRRRPSLQRREPGAGLRARARPGAPDTGAGAEPAGRAPRSSRRGHSLTLQVLSGRHELGAARFWIVHGGALWPSPRGLRHAAGAQRAAQRPRPRPHGLRPHCAGGGRQAAGRSPVPHAAQRDVFFSARLRSHQ